MLVTVSSNHMQCYISRHLSSHEQTSALFERQSTEPAATMYKDNPRSMQLRYTKTIHGASSYYVQRQSTEPAATKYKDNARSLQLRCTKTIHGACSYDVQRQSTKPAAMMYKDVPSVDPFVRVTASDIK